MRFFILLTIFLSAGHTTFSQLKHKPVNVPKSRTSSPKIIYKEVDRPVQAAPVNLQDVLVLKVSANASCKFYVDREFKGNIGPDKMLKINLRKGSYRLSATSTENSTDTWEEDYSVTETNQESFFEVDLEQVINERLEEEQNVRIEQEEREKEKEQRKYSNIVDVIRESAPANYDFKPDYGVWTYSNSFINEMEMLIYKSNSIYNGNSGIHKEHYYNYRMNLETVVKFYIEPVLPQKTVYNFGALYRLVLLGKGHWNYGSTNTENKSDFFYPLYIPIEVGKEVKLKDELNRLFSMLSGYEKFPALSCNVNDLVSLLRKAVIGHSDCTHKDGYRSVERYDFKEGSNEINIQFKLDFYGKDGILFSINEETYILPSSSMMAYSYSSDRNECRVGSCILSFFGYFKEGHKESRVKFGKSSVHEEYDTKVFSISIPIKLSEKEMLDNELKKCIPFY